MACRSGTRSSSMEEWFFSEYSIKLDQTCVAGVWIQAWSCLELTSLSREKGILFVVKMLIFPLSPQRCECSWDQLDERWLMNQLELACWCDIVCSTIWIVYGQRNVWSVSHVCRCALCFRFCRVLPHQCSHMKLLMWDDVLIRRHCTEFQIAQPDLCNIQDWQDIDFAIDTRVDFIAVSFVKSADVIENLAHYIERQTGDKNVIEVLLYKYVGPARMWGF